MIGDGEIGIVIPCLNEARHIGPVVTGARQFVGTVLVVDDGSTDSTSEIARTHGAVVLRHAVPQGKGAALFAGFRWLREHGYSYALAMDGDGQHASEDIASFKARAEFPGPALVVGNRMHDTAIMPWVRRCVNRWMSRRLSRLTGHDLPDTQCGFRLIRLESWAGLSFETSHFEVESELIVAFLAAGERVEFIPVRAIYNGGQSKIRPLIDSWRWMRWFRRTHRRARLTAGTPFPAQVNEGPVGQIGERLRPG